MRSLGRDPQATGELSSSEADAGVRITALSASGDDRVRVQVRVFNPAGSEEVEFLLLRRLSADMNLQVGELEPEILPEIEYWSEVTRAYFSACASFAYTPSSLKALERKLWQKSFERDVARDAVDLVRESGFVNEAEIALRRAQIFVTKRWGRTRIFMKLREEGFEESAMEQAKRYLDEVDFAENCAALIAKKYGSVPDDRHERELMYASLSRSGYSSADIRLAMEKCAKKNRS